MGPSLRSRITVCLAITLAQVIAVSCQEDAKKGERQTEVWLFLTSDCSSVLTPHTFKWYCEFSMQIQNRKAHKYGRLMAKSMGLSYKMRAYTDSVGLCVDINNFPSLEHIISDSFVLIHLAWNAKINVRSILRDGNVYNHWLYVTFTLFVSGLTVCIFPSSDRGLRKHFTKSIQLCLFFPLHSFSIHDFFSFFPVVSFFTLCFSLWATPGYSCLQTTGPHWPCGLGSKG